MRFKLIHGMTWSKVRMWKGGLESSAFCFSSRAIDFEVAFAGLT